jgi:S-formylglutathione hydrolase FrmB
MRKAAAAALGTLLVVLAGAAPAGAAQRLVTIATPSKNVNPAHAGGPVKLDKLRANVLLPSGYDGRRRFPVLFLLHGAGDSYSSWREPTKGDILNTARGLGAIVVMPEGAKGFYTNWWNGGKRSDPGWERFDLDELVPQIERRFRVLGGRRNHAVAGLSMGGFGASYLGEQLPGYFGASASFSGFVQPQRPTVQAAFKQVAGVNFEDIFGPISGFYASGHNPTKLVANLRDTRVYVTVGDGVGEPAAGDSPAVVAAGGAVEAELRQQNDQYVQALRSAGVSTTYVPLHGVHSWFYWRRALRAAIRWGLFRPVAEHPRNWDYRTVAFRGRMWALRYAFASNPPVVERIQRVGTVMVGSGSGTVHLVNGAGCGFTAPLPFRRAVPPKICGRLRVRVKPRRARLGRVTRVRFRVSRLADGRRYPVRGARVRIGHTLFKKTDSRGRATIRFRPHGHSGRRHARVTVLRLRSVSVRLRALPRRRVAPHARHARP